MKRIRLKTIPALLFFITALTLSQSVLADNVNYYDPTAAAGQRNKTATNAVTVTDQTTLGSSGTTSWYYVDSQVVITDRISVYGTVNLILTDDCDFTVLYGLKVASGNALNIYAQKAGDGCGKMYAGQGDHNAAIGADGGQNAIGTAGWGYDSGAITIYGGYINADGNIGGGDGGDGEEYTEHDDECGCEQVMEEGIGGSGGNGTVSIYGGVVTVNGAIGGGIGGYGYTGSCRETDGSGTVVLSWTNPTDVIYASYYNGEVTLQKDFSDESYNVYPAGAYYEYSDNDPAGITDVSLKPGAAGYNVTMSGVFNPVCLLASATRVMDGAEITLTAVNGYTVSSITVKDSDNGNVNVTDNGDGTWSFTMPAKNVTVTPVATKTHYRIDDDGYLELNVDNSIIMVQDGSTYYASGATISFTLTSSFGNNSELVGVNVYKDSNNEHIPYAESNGVYSFTMPAADAVITSSWIETSFRIIKYENMSFNVSEGGSVTINGYVYYKKDAEITVSVAIPQGKEVSSFSITDFNDVPVAFTDNGDGTYTFNMPGNNVTINVTFSIITDGLKLLEGTAAFTVTEGVSSTSRTYQLGDAEDDLNEGCTRLLDGKYSSTDASDYSKWCVTDMGDFENSGDDVYVEFQTAEPVIPKHYVLITGNDNSSNNGRNPFAWTIKAKLKETDGWDVIAGVTCSWGDIEDDDYTSYTFNFDNNADALYKYFRFEVSGTQGCNDEYGNPVDVNVMQLSELKMWVKDVDPKAVLWNADADHDGTSAQKPYIISSTQGLDYLAMEVNSGNEFENTNFKLGNDITYSYENLEETESNYVPIGLVVDPDNPTNIILLGFRGTFDGNGKTISGIRVYKDGGEIKDMGQGIFSVLGLGGTVKNLTVTDTRITATSGVGGIAGISLGTIENCNSYADLLICDGQKTGLFGGIAGGTMLGSIVGCTSHATITASESLYLCMSIGGVVGSNSCLIDNCKSYATINFGNYAPRAKSVGGIAGYSENNPITNCISSVVITSTDFDNSSEFGGIAGTVSGGYADNNISIDVAIPNVSYSGAILGYNDKNASFCYNYYSNCTIGIQSENIGYNGSDITTDDGAVKATILSETEAVPATLADGEKVAFRREFKQGVSSTVCLPFAIDAEQAAAAGKFYTFYDVDMSNDDWTVIMTEESPNNRVNGALEAHMPYLFVPANDGVTLFSGTADGSDVSAGCVDGGNWVFTGTYQNVVWDAGHENLGRVYGFAANKYEAPDNDGDSNPDYTINPGKFVKAGAGASILRYRAYLSYIPNVQNAPVRGVSGNISALPASMKVVLKGADGNTTAVGRIDTATGNVSIDTWYDLSGRQIEGAPAKGGMYIHGGKTIMINE